MTCPYRTGLLESYPYESHLESPVIIPHHFPPLRPFSLAVLSCVQFFATPWTVDCQAPLSTGFCPGNNSEVGCHALLQGMFPGIQPESLMSPALANGFFTTSTTWETLSLVVLVPYLPSSLKFHLF